MISAGGSPPGRPIGAEGVTARGADASFPRCGTHSPRRETPMRFMASRRVGIESRKTPRTAEVTVIAPGLRTPRMLMQLSLIHI